MKRIIFILLMITGIAYGQRYQVMPQPGYGPVKRMLIDSVLTIPTNLTGGSNITSGRDTGKIRYNIPDSSLQVYTGYQWWKPGVPLSSITAATATNSIDNANYGQTWAWDSKTTGAGFTLSINGTAAGSGQIVLSVASSGANASPNKSTYAGNFQNNKTGTGSNNYGINVQSSGASGFNKAGVFDASGAATNNYGATFSASGGTNNYAIIVPSSSGSVGIGTSIPDSLLTVEEGIYGKRGVRFSGLPTGAGTKAVRIDANGVLSTADTTAGGGLTVGTTTITSGTNTKILYNNSGVLGEYTISGSGNVAMTTSAALTTPTVATSIAPNSNDGAALGTTALQFSDLFLASGGVINWANGNTTLTQTSGALTLAGSFYSTGSVAAGTYLYGGDKYNTYAGYSGAVLGGISTHGVLDFIDNNNRIGEFYTDASNFNFFTDAGKGIVFYVNNSFTAPAMQFTSAGALRLGYLGAGALTADASGNITSVSDERLKDIQGYYGVGLNQVMKISPIVYKWNEKSGLDREHNYIGFSAQNIENNLGENAIGVNHDGYKSIQDRAIMAAMVNSIKDLKNLNDAQQKEINDLKKEVKKLKNP